MKQEKLDWCLQQKRGITSIDKNDNLAKAHMKEADETLENMLTAKGKWKTITAYYACYHALYANLMKCGIKSEIHECTIKMMEILEFATEDIDFLENLKEDRIKAQYYMQDIVVKDENRIKHFVLKCKTLLASLNTAKIERIRENLRKRKTSRPKPL